MDITNHAKERYVERIKGKNKQDMKYYTEEENERINKEILKLHEYSELIHRGQIGKDNTTKDFYLNGDICLVVDKTCIVTIFRINFAFPEQTRLKVIEDLKSEIQRLQEEIESEEIELAESDSQIEASINQLQNEIKALNEEIDIKKTEIEMHQATKKASRGKLRKLKSALSTYAGQLFNNTQYKKDIC